jgi:hypothetical protein
MHNELRYQAKTHSISEKLSREKIKFRILSHIFFLLKNETEKQQEHAYGKGNNI